MKKIAEDQVTMASNDSSQRRQGTSANGIIPQNSKKSSSSAKFDRANTAVEKLGVTNDFERSGFVISDGRMLNLTKSQFGAVHHSGIEAVYEDVKGRDAI